jgi:hypothetical protein
MNSDLIGGMQIDTFAMDAKSRKRSWREKNASRSRHALAVSELFLG